MPAIQIIECVLTVRPWGLVASASMVSASPPPKACANLARRISEGSVIASCIWNPKLLAFREPPDGQELPDGGNAAIHVSRGVEAATVHDIQQVKLSGAYHRPLPIDHLVAVAVTEHVITPKVAVDEARVHPDRFENCRLAGQTAQAANCD